MFDPKIVDKYNQKLRETYGENITVKILYILDDDGLYKFYYSGARCGESDWYNSPAEAYTNADDYLKNIEFYIE